jgi:cytochrome P450
VLPSSTRSDDGQFDHHSAEFVTRSWEIYEQLRADGPIAYTEKYGGFWVVSRYEDVKRIALDPATFSSVSLLIPSFNSYRMLPINADPPEHAKYRRILNPFFSVRAVRSHEPAMRAFTTKCINAFIARGSCDVMTELAQPVAAMRTMELVGLPPEKWDRYAAVVHLHDSTRFDDPGHLAAQAELVSLRQDLAAVTADRRSAPREDDLVTHLLDAEVDGQRLAPDEVADILLFIVMAGIDNTKASVGSALLYLHRDHAARDRLIADRGLIPNAVEEFLRYETPVPALARTATRDCVVGGQRISKGDRLMLLWSSANRDETVFPDADRVDLDREPTHIAFGVGAHHCLGAPLARAELRIVLEEVLRRIPDYVVLEDAIEEPQTIGLLYGKVRMPIVFSPGPPAPD